MTRDSAHDLLVLLDDIDWEAPRTDPAAALHLDNIKSHLPMLVDIALADTSEQATAIYEEMLGESPVGLFAFSPLQGADALIRLVPHASAAGREWIIGDLRALLYDALLAPNSSDAAADRLCDFIVGRRAVLDAAAAGSEGALRDLTIVAVLTQVPGWVSDLEAVALQHGVHDLLGDLDQRIRLAMPGRMTRPGADLCGSVDTMYRAGRAATLFDERALLALFLTWRTGRRRHVALLHADGKQDVIVGDTRTTSQWILRSDRAAMVALREATWVELARGGPTRTARTPWSRKAVARAWLDGQCREVRFPRSQLTSDGAGALTWADVLELFEETRR